MVRSFNSKLDTKIKMKIVQVYFKILLNASFSFLLSHTYLAYMNNLIRKHIHGFKIIKGM